MGNEKFATLVARSQKELVEKNDAEYMVHGFDRFAKWKFEKELGLLIYSNPDGFKAVVPVQLAGTRQTANGEWLWGWANQAVPDSIKADAKQVGAWGEQNGVPTLTNASVPQKRTKGETRSATYLPMLDSPPNAPSPGTTLGAADI
jgi:hypothetical protein